MDKRFEYYFYDLFSNEKTLDEVIKIIWEPNGYEAIKKVYREIDWSISNKEYEKIKSDYKTFLSKIYKKYPHFKINDYGLNKEHKEALLVRYELIGALSNVSLSVPQEIKVNLMKLGLKHELFGSFFNTQSLLTYCCLFPDLESPRCKSDFYQFSPMNDLHSYNEISYSKDKGEEISYSKDKSIGKKKEEISYLKEREDERIQGYLVNPPYNKNHIKASGEKVMEWVKDSHNLRFFIILPAWDVKTRSLYGLKSYSDLPIISKLIDSEYRVFHKVFEEFPFYDGVKNRLVNLSDVPIHVIILQSKNLFWNKNIEKLFLELIKIH